jgi:hypothetical protein
VYDGTWGGGALPGEIVDFELMRGMNWSWDELQATPAYVQRYCWDLMQIRAEAEQAAYDRSSST